MKDYILPYQSNEEIKYHKQRGQVRPIRVRVGNTHLAEAIEADTYRQKALRCTRGGAGIRTSIAAFSKESQRRAMFYFEDVLSGIHWDHFITLTYHTPPKDGIDCKLQLKRLLEYLKRDMKNPGLKAFWWLEFQKRGAVHFHIVAANLETLVREGTGETVGTHFWTPKDQNVYCGTSLKLCQVWSRVAEQVDQDTLKHCARWEAVQAPRAMGAYLAKYIRKAEQKIAPKWMESIGRFWGSHGCAEEKTAARGMERVYVPASLLACAERDANPGGYPYSFQWRKAEVIKEWLLTDEGMTYQIEAKFMKYEPYIA